MSSLSSSSDKDDPSRVTAEETESEDTEAAATETVPGAGDFTADMSSADIGSLDTDAILNASSEDKGVEVGTSVEGDEASMDELGAAEASAESTLVASTSRPISAEEAIEEHATVGVVTRAERVVETTPIAITSSGGTVQGGPSGSGSRVDPSLLDSSPSTRQYVRRTRKGSIVSTDSERTVSAIVSVPTPPSPLPESGGTAPTPITTAAETSSTATVQEGEVVPIVIEEIPVGEEGPAHVPNILEGNNFVESIPIDENLVIYTDFGVGVTQIEYAEVAASEDPIQAGVILGSDVPVIEEELAQDPVDDIDMADAHDSYDEVLAETEDHVAGAQAADIGVIAPVTAHASPTETDIWPFINILPLLLLDGRDFLKCIDMT